MQMSGRILAFCALLLYPTSGIAADAPRDALKFFAGAAIAFGIHEAGHVTFDEIFDAHPRVHSVHYGPIPFFAVSPERPLFGRKLYTVAAAGFWTQMATTELLQGSRDMRREHAPFEKGMFAFDVLTSIGYGIVAFTQTGPPERDTRGMAEGARIAEPVAGAIVLAPALLAAYRYFRPQSRWAKWASRIAAGGSVVIVVKN
jgi:hypothetical protein